jgi:hypothetical protein
MPLTSMSTGHRPALPTAQRPAAMPHPSRAAALPSGPVLHGGGAPAQRLLPLRRTR